MPYVTEIQDEQISHLNSTEGVAFFGDLLHAEARHLGIGPVIRISGRTNAPDGGVDASVENDTGTNSGLMPAGYTGYQIKTGETFRVTAARLQKELFGRGSPIKLENLNTSIRHCLERGGRFVFVCFGIDPTESKIIKATTKIVTWLTQCGIDNHQIQIWGIGTIKNFLKDFTALRLRLTGRSIGPLEIFETWKQHGDMLPASLSLGDPQKNIIDRLRNDLLTNTAAIQRRIIGESGVGKTRLALEILSDEKLRPLVLYTDRPEQVEGSGFLTEIALADNHFEVILVLDECSRDIESRYWNRVQNLGKRVRLITIYNSQERERENISLPPLEQGKVEEILATYEIPQEHLRRWALFCEGSPRFAHILGENLQSNADDILKDPVNVPVVRRYIAGADNLGSETVKKRLMIARFLSLFKRFGFKGEVAAEATAIYQLIKRYDDSLTRAVFDESINNLHDRRILQGEKTYYITPKPLQIKLWVEWWDNYGGSFDFDNFSKLPPPLPSGFNDMLRFAQESEAATRTVEALLGKDGPFADGKLFGIREGGEFFLALTEASPEKALQRIEETLGTWDKQQLMTIKDGRMSIVWALERIAVWDGLFVPAASLMMKLAEAENDFVYSNNATGTFKDLFSVFSATEEPPLKRLPILVEAISSKDPIKEKLAIKAMEVALDNHFTRMIGAEYQGIRKEPKLWSPRENPKEAQDYMNQVWALALDSLLKVGPENKAALQSVVRHQIQVSGRHPEASKVTLADARRINKEGSIEKKDLVETVVHILHYGSSELTDDIKKLWQDFYEELIPKNDFSAQLERYVALNLTEDYFPGNGSYSEEAKDKPVKDLAEQALKNISKLTKNLSWLVTERARNGYTFGYELGKRDTKKELLKIILGAWMSTEKENHPNQYFLGGYLRAVYEDNPKQWEQIFDDFAQDPNLINSLPELVWRAGVNDTIANQLAVLMESEKLPATGLHYFKYGREIRGLSDESLERWINLLMAQKDRGPSSIALTIFERYFGDLGATAKSSKDLALRVITDDGFFEKVNYPTGPMDQFLWAKVASRFIREFGSDRESLLKIGFLMLDNLGNDGSIVDHTERDVKNILYQITELFPDEMWIRALENIEVKGYFIFKHWLSAGDFFGHGDLQSSIVKKINLNILWKWINEKLEERAWFVASLVPNNFNNEPGEVNLARELLIRYGDRKDVRRNLMANFYSEGWFGEASDHYQRKLDAIKTARARETDQKVIKWLDEYIDQLKASIENAKTSEERDEFWAG